MPHEFELLMMDYISLNLKVLVLYFAEPYQYSDY